MSRLSVPDREAFLAQPHIGVLSVEPEPDSGRPPLTHPVWYHYQPGGLVVIMSAPHKRKVRLIRAAGRFSLCVQTETAPYTYVSVEGQVVEILPVTAEHRQRAARHYLGDDAGAAWVAATVVSHAQHLEIRMKPEVWHSRRSPRTK